MEKTKKGHIYAVGKEEKCGCCNCFTYKTFLVAESKEKAKQRYGEFDESQRALCGECITEMLMNNEATIIGGW